MSWLSLYILYLPLVSLPCRPWYEPIVPPPCCALGGCSWWR